MTSFCHKIHHIFKAMLLNALWVVSTSFVEISCQIFMKTQQGIRKLEVKDTLPKHLKTHFDSKLIAFKKISSLILINQNTGLPKILPFRKDHCASVQEKVQEISVKEHFRYSCKPQYH